MLHQNASLLCIGAHSDDAEIGCAGTILRILETSPTVTVDWVVLAAEGDRAKEAEESARRLLGDALGSLHVLNFTERYLPYAPQVKRFFDELGANVEPDLILCPGSRDLHQDHRVAAELTWNTFRNHWILEYEIVKYEGDLHPPNFYVPLSLEQIKAKVDHLMTSFPSQLDRYWFVPETFEALARIRGIESRSDSGYAEGFHAKKLVWR